MAPSMNASCVYQNRPSITCLCAVSFSLIAIGATISIALATDHELFHHYDVVNTRQITMNKQDASFIGIPTHYRSLDSVLSRYESKSEIRRLLQEIESNIEFTNSISSAYNHLYSTSYSPHYYNGPYDLQKTSKHVRFPYLCRPDTINIIRNWTFKLDETNLTHKAKTFLHELQRNGFYGNLYSFYMDNLHTHRSPYIRPMNVLWFGNSHRKQITQSIFALIDSLDLVDIDDIVRQYVVPVHPINKTQWQAFTPKWSELRCDGWGLHAPNDWPGQNVYDFGLNSSPMRSIMDHDRIKNNIEKCDTTPFHYTNFKDNSNDTSFMMHYEQHKTLKSAYQRIVQKINESILGKHINMWDTMNVTNHILIFNVGNEPRYDANEHLEEDLQFLHMKNRGVIFMSQWFHSQWMKAFEHGMYGKYSNIILIDWSYRLRLIDHHLKLQLQGWASHFCMPGVPDHAMLSIIHLTNILKLVDDHDME